MKIINALVIILILFSSCKREYVSDAYGNFETREIIVSAMAGGPIVSLKIEEGQTLDSGQIAGIIDTTSLVIQKEQLLAKKEAILVKSGNIEAQAKAIREQLSSLQIEKERLEKLFKEGAATSQQMDDINGKIKVLNAQIESVQSQQPSISKEAVSIDKQIDLIDYQLNNCKIVNPLKGTVLTKYAEQSEVVSMGKPIYKIADLRNMYLRAYISGGQLSSVKIGQKVKVLIDDKNKKMKELTGIVSWISSNAEFTPKIIQTKETRVNLVYAMKVKVSNDGSLKIGMPGEVRFE
ncbi:MAG: HlyD family efflux transporter periplasmic adaptor subunit [Sphingobacteriales bacterium]|nr:HlyD family efflux transporter periplasmic adaptor subunit [Sphingobacteriales bacterium]